MSNRLNPTLIDGRIIAKELLLQNRGDFQIDYQIRCYRVDTATGQINGYTVY